MTESVRIVIAVLAGVLLFVVGVITTTYWGYRRSEKSYTRDVVQHVLTLSVGFAMFLFAIITGELANLRHPLTYRTWMLLAAMLILLAGLWQIFRVHVLHGRALEEP